MSKPKTSRDSPAATSSPGSEAGTMPSSLPDGPQSARSGRVRVRANPSPSQAPRAVQMTFDISGLYGRGSSKSHALQQSLESRLRAQLDTDGSTLFSMTWKEAATPAGRSYSRLQASARRTSGSDCGLWPTPTSTDRPRSPETMEKCLTFRKGNGQTNVPLYLGEVAQLASWPTPKAVNVEETPEHWEKRNAEAKAKNAKLGEVQKALGVVAQLASWPTTQARDWKGGQADRAANAARSNDLNDFAKLASWATPKATDAKGAPYKPTETRRTELRKQTFALASWPTAKAGDANSSGSAAYSTASGRHSGTTLTDAASWATPAARDHKDTGDMSQSMTRQDGKERNDTVPRQAFGMMSSGSPAETASPGQSVGQLNPFFSLSLMGYPVSWGLAGMRSLPKSKRR